MKNHEVHSRKMFAVSVNLTFLASPKHKAGENHLAKYYSKSKQLLIEILAEGIECVNSEKEMVEF